MPVSLRKILNVLRARDDWEQSLDDELSSHIAMRADDLERSGLTRKQAVRRARLELGSRERYKDEVRAAFGIRALDELAQDVRYALRTLRRDKAFAAVAVLSLALGVGVNTIVFGILNTVLFKPMPGIVNPQELYFVGTTQFWSVSFPNYRDLRDRNRSFTGLVADRIVTAGLNTGGRSEQIWGFLATANYFDVLGVRPLLGRFFTPAEDVHGNAGQVVVFSYAAWQSRFGRDPQIVGKTVRLNGQPLTVIGVAPLAFRGTELFFAPEFWLPVGMQPQLENVSYLEARAANNFWVTGRLARGVSRQQAQAEVDRLATVLAREYPQINGGFRYQLAPPGLIGDGLRGPVETFVSGLTVLAALVLLAACANLASMLAARSSDRFREIALRISIGAGPARVVRQLLTESVVLTVAAGAIGCAIAAATLRWLAQYQLPMPFPSIQFNVDTDADPRVFLFALGASILTGALAGVLPAQQALRMDANQMLKGVHSIASGKRWAVRDVLVPVQIALCSALVVASLTSIRSLTEAFKANLGMTLEGASVVAFDPRLAHYGEPEGHALQRRLVDEAATLPGVVATGYADTVPLGLGHSSGTVFREDATDFRQSQGINVTQMIVSPGYFKAIGTRLLSGREYAWSDVRQPAGTRIAIVNETFARRIIGTANAVGRRFRYGPDADAEVIGLVEDGKFQALTEAPEPALFLPATRVYSSDTVLIVRSRVSETVMANQLQQMISRIDPNLPVGSSTSLASYIRIAYFPTVVASVLLGVFGVIAALLAVAGIYGTASYSVSRRIREIGIRMAIGAGPRQVLSFVLGRTSRLVAIGAVLGLVSGVAANRLLASIVYRVSDRDPLTVIAAALIIMLVAVLAVSAPARRAVRLDPQQALRQE
ncbi:MAG: ABC transporter substrate-binding protein [Blastocatellia bacterium]|nr:MAG: ABC transporter substrate-binding protein [Blastocatellia bacterium]